MVKFSPAGKILLLKVLQMQNAKSLSAVMASTTWPTAFLAEAGANQCWKADQ